MATSVCHTNCLTIMGRGEHLLHIRCMGHGRHLCSGGVDLTVNVGRSTLTIDPARRTKVYPCSAATTMHTKVVQKLLLRVRLKQQAIEFMFGTRNFALKANFVF